MSSRGLTLVEMLVSLALGSVLCLAATTMLLAAKRTYLQDEQLGRLQENGQYALRLLSRELSMAGFYGARLGEEIAPAMPGGSSCYRHFVDLSSTLSHYDNVTESGISATGEALPVGCSRPGDHQPGSDVVVVRRVMDRPAARYGQLSAALSRRLLYLQDDEHGARLVRDVSAGSAHSMLWRFHPQQFFLRNYSRTRGDGLPSLCRIRLSPEIPGTAPVECLIEGIEQLQLEFGIDTDGDHYADRYVPVLAEADTARAVLVRVHLLVRTPLSIPGHLDHNHYRLGNSEFVAPGDRYFRRVMSTSVLLRNSDVHRS